MSKSPTPLARTLNAIGYKPPFSYELTFPHYQILDGAGDLVGIVYHASLAEILVRCFNFTFQCVVEPWEDQ